MDNKLIPYQPVISDIKNLITAGQNIAYNAANRAMVMTYWNIGKRIVEEEQSGAERAEYGKRLIPVLSAELTKEFGNSYSSRNLHYYRKFYSNAIINDINLYKKRILLDFYLNISPTCCVFNRIVYNISECLHCPF